jgi:hypothetical protein
MLARTEGIMRTFLLAALCLGWLQGCSLCDESVQKESPGPNVKLTAQVVVRDCGATTGFATVVRLRKRFRDVDVAVFRGKVSVSVEWTSDNELRVSLPDSLATKNVFREEAASSGIQIRYVRRAPTPE